MSSAFDFSSRVVWVTGAASGQGASHATRFAEAGARVACIDVKEDSLREVVERIQANGGAAESFPADVADWEQMEAVADAIQRELGPASIVVANAGIVPPTLDLIEDIDPGDWQRVVGVNLTGAFYTAKAAIPQLRGSQKGSLIFVSSIAGLCGYPGYAAYSATKHGVLGLMRAAANELGDDGVRVNAICPATVDTPMLSREAENFGIPRAEFVVGSIAGNIFKRPITVDETSDAVLWLTSDLAVMVTGVTLPVDGGYLEQRAMT